MDKLVILTGPTAVGKTEISIKLAKAIGGEIISADSIQVYKHMDIGSAKITKEEMDGVPHHLIDVLEPNEDFNVHIFQSMANQCMKEIYSRNRIPIIVGGTGFYIQSVLYDIDFEDTDENQEYREYLEQLAQEKGSAYLHNMLKEIDAESAENIHSNNTKRVIRALEYYNDTGHMISEHNKEQRQKVSPYDFVYFVLNDNRATLYSRINRRVDKMIDDGLVNEVKNLLEQYGYCNASMQGIGYKEIIQYINGEIDLDQAIELIKKNTRHFAKRQLTWFRREKDVTMMDYEKFYGDKEKVLNKMIDILKQKNIIENI